MLLSKKFQVLLIFVAELVDLQLKYDVLNFQDRNGNLATGAIINLVDEVGNAPVHIQGLSVNVSVDMSISFLSTAKLDVSKCLSYTRSTFIMQINLHLKTSV